jgi:cation diffusion facilitator family transporter
MAAEAAKRRAAITSLVTNCTLTCFKLAAAAVTGSVGLFSEAAHSATDVVASALAVASVRAASVPADEEHNYGHGKIESLGGFAESILMGAIVVYIVFESVPRLMTPRPLGHTSMALLVMTGSAIASLVVGTYVRRVGERTESLALKTNGRHLSIDFWTSTGVLAALALYRFGHWQQADPVIALLLGGWIGRNAFQMGREAFQQLIDRRVSDEDLELIHDALQRDDRILSYHKLRTRHSGSFHYIEVHVVVPRDQSLLQAHDIADTLEHRIESFLPPAQVVVHVDPYDPSKAAGAKNP